MRPGCFRRPANDASSYLSGAAGWEDGARGSGPLGEQPFALDIPLSAPKGAGGIAVGIYELFASMIEFGLSRCLSRIAPSPIAHGTSSDVPAGRLRESVNRTRSVTRAPWTGYLDISADTLEDVRRDGGFHVPCCGRRRSARPCDVWALAPCSWRAWVMSTPEGAAADWDKSSYYMPFV